MAPCSFCNHVGLTFLLLSILVLRIGAQWREEKPDREYSEKTDCFHGQWEDEDEVPIWCHSHVAVELASCNDSAAMEIAQNMGYNYHGQVGSLKCHYLFSHKFKGRVHEEIYQTLKSHPDVKWSEPQRREMRDKRDFIPPKNQTAETNDTSDELDFPWQDPLYKNQWYLRSGASGGSDVRVREAWRLGYSGINVTTAIVDDGMQWRHPDLKANYDPKASTDIRFSDSDPTPYGKNKHGTRCAGVVGAVAGNSWCGVGIAYNSHIGGIRLLDKTNPGYDYMEAEALSFNQEYIDIYSCSWGPRDNGYTLAGPGPLTKKAFYKGITEGRNGKGNIFVWASGNGGYYGDSCSCDGYASSIYTLSIAAATRSNTFPWYGEECPSTLTTTYSSYDHYHHTSVVKKDAVKATVCIIANASSLVIKHDGVLFWILHCVIAHVIAIDLLQGVNRRNLTWRDIQHLVVRTSNATPLIDNDGWMKNGAGRKVSSKFGYGLMDAGALVTLAKTWHTVPDQHSCFYNYLTYDWLRMRSVLLPRRPDDRSLYRRNFTDWSFVSVQQWGEDPRGVWTLTMENTGRRQKATFEKWSLILYGTQTHAQNGDPINYDGEGVKENKTKVGSFTPTNLQVDKGKSFTHTHVQIDGTFGIALGLGLALLVVLVTVAYILRKYKERRGFHNNTTHCASYSMSFPNPLFANQQFADGQATNQPQEP